LEQLGDYLDEDARQEICKAIEAHLTRCHDCRFEVDTLKQTIVLYQNEEPTDMPVTVRSSLQAALASEYKTKPGAD
jgi:predicted anti-sigma-YlaC factor YlaD